jgi:predicted ATPase
VAAEALGDVPDGVWLADLASLSDPALLLSAVAQAVGVREGTTPSLQPDVSEPARPLVDLVVEHVAPKHLLVVLDNCEHLLGACAQVVEVLLRAGPGVRVLCTSREPLGVGVETTWRVPSLGTPDAGRLVPSGELAKYEAVRLFLERAAQREPGFALTDRSAPAVAQICQRLDGIPLAIELAAARVRVLTPEQIANRLDDRFTLLTGGSRVALERHQTLRAAVDWSYDTLGEAERVLLRRISVFAGGFTLEAAEGACAFGHLAAADVVDLLGQLIDKSLLTMEPHRDHARYRLLETIRQYGQERLVAAGEVEEQRVRHQQYFLVWAERTRPRMWGSDQAAAMEEAHLDADNVAQAVAWSLAREEWGVALRLAAALDRFWSVSRPNQGRLLLEDALEAAPVEASLARAHALSTVGLLACQAGDYVPARQRLNDSQELYRQLGVSRGVIWSLLHMAILDHAEDRLAEMTVHLEEALTLARKSRDPQTVGWALTDSALLSGRRGDYAQQQSAAEEALGLFRRSGDQIGIAFALNHLAAALQGQGDYERSVSLLEEVIAVEQSGLSLISPLPRGNAALALGDLESARQIYQQSANSLLERSMPYQYTFVLCLLGEVALAAADLDEASDRYRAALDARSDLPPPTLLCMIASGAAKLATEQGHPEAAARLFGAVEATLQSLGVVLPPVVRASQERCQQIAHDALGDDEYEAARRVGGQLTTEEAVVLVRAELRSV